MSNARLDVAVGAISEQTDSRLLLQTSSSTKVGVVEQYDHFGCDRVYFLAATGVQGDL